MYRGYVWRFALLSRLFFIYFSAICNSAIEDHESVDTFENQDLGRHPKSKLDNVLLFLGGGLLRWDAHHFYHISRHGYTYENNLAFFPVYPLFVRFCSIPLKFFLGHVLETTTLFLLCSLSLNIVVFCLAAVYLYDLTLKLYQNPLFAYKTSIFFCLSPGTVFFLAPYTETLYSFFVFYGMLQNALNKKLYSCFCFAVSAGIRSNGFLNVGFVVHTLAYGMIEIFKPNTKLTLEKAVRVSKICFLIFGAVLLVISPYLLFQFYGYYEYCLSKNTSIPDYLVDYALKNNLTTPSSEIEWCAALVPLPYFHVQHKYWSVGFLRYYTWRQIPNFLLAAPVTVMILFYGLPYIASNKLLLFRPRGVYRIVPEKEGVTFPKCVFVHVVHAVFLTLFCVTTVNVQVTTRMLACSTPVVYWIAAKESVKLSKARPDGKNKRSRFLWKLITGPSSSKAGRYIRLFFVFYTVVGIAAFSNNFPWT